VGGRGQGVAVRGEGAMALGCRQVFEGRHAQDTVHGAVPFVGTQATNPMDYVMHRRTG